MLEIERKFLLKNFPGNIKKAKTEEILQGYLSMGKNPLRVRQKGKIFELAKKLNVVLGDKSQREEIIIPIDKKEFKKLWPLTVKYLKKTRFDYHLPYNLLAEIDVFRGKLTGFVMVEIEFKTTKARDAFVPPKWFGQDITHKHWSANSYLAGKKFEDIKKFLT